MKIKTISGQMPQASLQQLDTNPEIVSLLDNGWQLVQVLATSGLERWTAILSKPSTTVDAINNMMATQQSATAPAPTQKRKR